MTHHETAILAQDPGNFTGGLAFSPDGSSVAAIVGCELHVWDPVTHATIGPPIDLHYVTALARGPGFACDPGGGLSFAADGSLLVDLGSAGPIYVWSPLLTNTSRWVFAHSICTVVDRNLTRPEYAADLPGEPYHVTCPGR